MMVADTAASLPITPSRSRRARSPSLPPMSDTARPDASTHTGTDSGSDATAATVWERLDAPSSTPRPVGSLVAATAPVRLRRRRQHVIESLDAGGATLQRSGRRVLTVSSLLLLPIVVLNLWATAQVFDRTGGTTLRVFGGDAVGTGVEDVAAVLVVLCSSLAGAVVGAFATGLVMADTFGGPSSGATIRSRRGDLARVFRRLPTVLAAWGVGHVWLPFVATWALSGSSGGAGRVTLAAIVATLASTGTLLVVPVAVAEGVGPMRALRRGWRLARARFATCLGFLVTSTLLGGLLLGGIASLPQLLEATGFVAFGELRWLVQGLAGQVGVIVVVPLVALSTAHLYLAVRVDAEGLDLVIEADAAFGPRSASPGEHAR